MKRLYVYILFIGLMLSACAPQQATQPSDGPLDPAATPTLVRSDLTWEQSLLVAQLSKQTGVSVNDIVVAETTAITWPDHCMGIVRMGVMCAQGEVPGFRFVLSANSQNYEYHTNQDMSVILLAENK